MKNIRKMSRTACTTCIYRKEKSLNVLFYGQKVIRAATSLKSVSPLSLGRSWWQEDLSPACSTASVIFSNMERGVLQI
jgi:hypothetical protein